MVREKPNSHRGVDPIDNKGSLLPSNRPLSVSREGALEEQARSPSLPPAAPALEGHSFAGLTVGAVGRAAVQRQPDVVLQLGKYDDREFIGTKNSPTHVHIYNKTYGHVKVSGVAYKYGYPNSEEQNMRDAKAALSQLNKEDVSEYDDIMGFIDEILEYYD